VVAQTAQAALRLVPHHVHALGVQVHGASVALVVQVPPDWAQNDENITDIADELGALLGPEIAVRTEVGWSSEGVGQRPNLTSELRTPQPWVWLVVVWDDGVKERAVEDYPPWTYVTEMRAGYFDWEGHRAGHYGIEWVPPEPAPAERERLDIRPEDS
jgi:hypothetical protein